MQKFRTRDLTLIALFAALMAICSWISVPTAVPFTLQTFGVFVSVALLGGRRGTWAVFVYILLGAVGLPVFAGFSGGIGRLLGATGGYITGFLLAALLMWLITSRFGSGTAVLALSMVLGLLVCYAFGTVWFSRVYAARGKAMSIGSVLSLCVVPFLVPDGLKIALALLLSQRLRRVPSLARQLEE